LKILSRFRKIYTSRLVFRIAVLVATVLLYIFAPSQFDVLRGFECFKRFSVFWILWVLWVFDMIMQLIPSKKYWPLGSQKFLKESYKMVKRGIDLDYLKAFIKQANKGMMLVAVVWVLLNLAIGAGHLAGLYDEGVMLIIAVAFYVCDIICVLYWCPFRVWFMKNRCCTTCRIFNWDHIMMCSPLFFVPGVFTWSLCAMALVVFVVWEVTFYLHPERFWEGSNENLQCHNCPDQLCGQRNCKIGLSNIKDLKNDLRGNSDV
ncbi:MAG: hypothetical protein IKV47_03140, partial [Oscillospiraceae bacterium]|nr:hypothetical protein [Oscillospiraceae bacterium]